MDEPTDQGPRIIDHPFRPLATRAGAWPDICGYQYPTGWPCGYSRDEHDDQGGDDA